MRPDMMSAQTIALCNDTLAIKDKTDEKREPKHVILFVCDTKTCFNTSAYVFAFPTTSLLKIIQLIGFLYSYKQISSFRLFSYLFVRCCIRKTVRGRETNPTQRELFLCFFSRKYFLSIIRMLLLKIVIIMTMVNFFKADVVRKANCQIQTVFGVRMFVFAHNMQHFSCSKKFL